jgi:hypothetical protein
MMKGRTLIVALCTLVLAACSAEPGSATWCDQKREQPKSEWTLEDATTFASHCLIDSLTVGSEAWCANLKEKPKGEWTADEAASFARYCVI